MIFYLMLEGEVQVTKVINQSEVRLLTNLGPGDFFGEMALIHNAPRAASVTTVQPTTVLEINKQIFDQMLHRNASVSLAMVREVSRRLRENDEMAIEDLRVKSQELALAYQQLAEQEYAQHEFLSTIAHELRTPLTAIRSRTKYRTKKIRRCNKTKNKTSVQGGLLFQPRFLALGCHRFLLFVFP